jgi:hypothetical protein
MVFLVTLSLSLIQFWIRPFVEIIVGPNAERDEPASGPISTGRHFRRRGGHGVSRGGKAPLGLVVGRLLDGFDKEIARSVLFLSPVLLATRQSVIDD